MRHLAIILVLTSTASLLAQGGDILQGKIKKLDVDRQAVTLTHDGKDREFFLTEQTKVFGSDAKNVKERMKILKEGDAVLFKPAKADDKAVLVGIKLIDGKQPKQGAKFEKVDSSKLKPLTEMGVEKYQGHAGGLYPDGKNTRPREHEKGGLALAQQVQPRDAAGKPSPDGKIVLLSIGMSNTSQASEGFARVLAKESDINPQLVFVNGAQGGMTAFRIKNPNDQASGTQYWSVVDQRLKSAGVTREQVQAVWIKQADAGPRDGFPKYAKTLQEELATIVQLFPERFPNARLVYLSSRTYGGYATTGLNPEPYAFESGLSVRWLIEQQLNGDKSLAIDGKAPWLSWGPYLWANGTTKRADGFFYEMSDFAKDGTHHSSAGQLKLGQEMLSFFKNDTTTRTWFTQGNKRSGGR